MGSCPPTRSRRSPRSTDPHANDAAPYGGGDPYADYRAGDFPFTELVDLADRRLGAGVIAANDEFFAERENLLIRERAVFDPERFGHKGKIMDGWETRRRRGADADHPFPAPEDHDWAIVRLGAPGDHPRHRRRHRPLPRQLPAARLRPGHRRAKAPPAPRSSSPTT